MAENERPLSDFITSIEQVDAPEVAPEDMGENPKQKKSKVFLIIVSILLLLIVGVGGYYIYDNYIDKDEVIEEEQGLIPEESTLEFGDIFIDLDGEKILYVKAPSSSCDDTGYRALVQESTGYLIYEDNQNEYCSDSNIISYFKDEETMTSYLSQAKTEYPLEKETINSVEYEYILKEDSTNETGSAHGLVYQKSPTINVKDFEAFHIINYIKIAEEGDNTVIEGSYPEDDSVYTNFTKYCVFPLSQLGEEFNGFLMFNGSSSIGSEIDYCEVLNSSEYFNLEIQ